MKMRVALIAVLAALFPCFVLAEQARVTVELDDRAIVITSDGETVVEIEKWAAEPEVAEIMGVEAEKILKEKYGDRIEIEVFRAGEPAAAGVEIIRLPLRRAVLTGRIPPIEGLTMDEALIVLGMFDFSVVPEREYTAMNDQDRIRALIEAEGPFMVISGTGPFDDITIYLRNEKAAEQ